MAKLKEEFGNTLSSLFSAMKSEEKKTSKQEKQKSRKVRGTTMSERKAVDQKQITNSSITGTFAEEVGRTMNTTTQKNTSPKNAIVVNKSKTVKMIRPKSEDDSYFIIEELKMGQTICVKLNAVEKEARQQILDRIYGACQMKNYKVEQTDDQEVLIDPNYQ